MHTQETVAVIDVGSNSIKLIVASLGSARNRIQPVFTETIETRISKGISRQSPELNKEAMAAGCEAIVELVRLAKIYQPKAMQIVATSAVRDAINAAEFINKVHKATKHWIKVLSGIEEATYICKGLSCDPQISGRQTFVQMDIGGGSLELVRFGDGTIRQACSLQLGAVRLTEQFVADPTAPIALETETRIQNHVKETLKASGFTFEPASAPLIVTGGAFTVTRAVIAAQVGKTIKDSPPAISKRDIDELRAKLGQLSLHERLEVPHLPASRADVMPAALITIKTVLDCADRDTVTHSFYNLRYGVAAELLECA